MEYLCSKSEIVLTVEDFINSGWKSYIEDKECESYSDIWGAFNNAVREAHACEDKRKEKLFQLLTSSCSMILRPENINEPYKPFYPENEKRTVLPQDYNKSDLSFFECILPEVNNYMLKARLADILWLVKKPRNHQFALIAIDNYLLFSLEPNLFFGDIENAWKRAIDLSLQLREGAKDNLNKIIKTLYKKFQNAKYDDRFYALKISKLLKFSQLPTNKFNLIANKLKKYGKKAIEAKDWLLARPYFEKAIDFLSDINQFDEVNRIRVLIAESWVSEANNRSSQMIKGSFLENAIHSYRQIPKKERSKFNVDKRIDVIRKQMSEANRLSLNEMQKIMGPSIDLSDIVEQCRRFIHDKKYPDVLRDFSLITSCIDYDQMKENAKKSLEEFPLQSLFPSTKFDSEGRVVSRSQGLDLTNPNCPENDRILKERILQNYLLGVQIDVKARILPALDVITCEHYITEDDMVSLCNESTFVPRDRVLIWTKGLLSGLERDYIISSHLLIPQLEHFVRIQLKIRGENTSTIDSLGIENENGLSNLLENPKVEEIFGENLTFESQSLLTSHSGPNLRNNLAHGLLEPNGMTSCYSIYFWWLCFRLVILSIPWMHSNME